MGEEISGARKPSQATRLLTKVVATGRYDVTVLAAELVVDERTLGLYIAGEAPMPIDRQLCFARFLIERVPDLSRQGHNLLGQLRAQIQFASGDTATHQVMPVNRWR